jgi:hypothetical protein
MGSVIGFSTQKLKWEIGINEAIDVIQKNSFNGIVLSYETPLKLMQEIGDQHLNMLSKFDYVAIHAPWLKVRYNTSSKMLLKRLDFLAKVTNAQHIVFHPDVIDNWKIIRGLNMPIVFENMSNESFFGTTVEHMELINRQGFGVALDIGNAYSMDKTFGLARRILKLKPVHVSVSGKSGKNINCILSKSENRSKVLEFLKRCKGIPLILETDFSRRNDKLLKSELSLLRSHDKK